MSRELPPRRKYELKKRAEQVAETHLRITEAAIDLHGTVGPARTTLSAVAERAGVERRTLYRHFPTESDLFAACSTHYFSANPWPDLAGWRAIRDPQERLEQGLDELYAYYERTEPMLSNVLRDAELVDFARDAVAPLHAYLEEAAEILTDRPWSPRPKTTAPRGSAAPRPRLLDLALTLGQRHRALRCGEARRRARRSRRPLGGIRMRGCTDVHSHRLHYRSPAQPRDRYDAGEFDPATRRVFRATIDWFEAKGKAAITSEVRTDVWYADFIEFLARERVFATLLTPARDAGSDPDKRWDTARNAVFNEILGFYGLPYWYAWQVTILGPRARSGRATTTPPANAPLGCSTTARCSRSACPSATTAPTSTRPT